MAEIRPIEPERVIPLREMNHVKLGPTVSTIFPSPGKI